MALNDLFTAIKADRYTADGCEKLNEALAKDKTYQTGQISEKTGLQKQPDGSWAPPKETKFGKVQQNKEGQWGVQVKQGKGSDFLKHKDEKTAKRALANYTRGYNTTERSKQDPHSDEARLVKHWDKETEQIRKNNRAEGRAAHAAQFQKPAAESKPVAAPKIDVGSNVKVKVNGGREGKVVEKRGDLVTVEMPATRNSPARRDQYYESDLEASESKPAESKSAAGMQKVPGAQRGTKEFDKNEYIDSMKNSKNAPVSRMAREIQRETFDDEIKNTSGDKAKIEALTKQLLSPATKSGAKITAEAQERAKNLIESRYRQLTVSESKPAAKSKNKTTIRQGPNTKTLNETPAEHIKKNWDYYGGRSSQGDADVPADAAPRVLTGDTKIRVRK